MPKAQHADREQRGGPVNIWLPGPLRSKLQALKDKHKVSWSRLLELLLAGKIRAS